VDGGGYEEGLDGHIPVRKTLTGKDQRLGPSIDDHFEFGAFDPHSVQNDGKLSSDRNLGFAQPASLRKPDTPGFKRRPLCYAGEQDIGCLVKVTSQHRIAAFRDFGPSNRSHRMHIVGSSVPRRLRRFSIY
jgi:hypothetical protein